jgi:hypothetical protein
MRRVPTQGFLIVWLATAMPAAAAPELISVNRPDDGATPWLSLGLAAGSLTIASNVVPGVELAVGNLISVPPSRIIADDDAPFAEIAKDLPRRSGNDWLQ